MSKKFIVATRPSLLAYTQTQQTVELLKAKNPDCEFEIVKISTHGDAVTNKPLTAFGGTGVFVKELENAILEGKADFAIHSLKDVPTIDQLNDHCVIGTGSPRRMVQIAELKPKATFADLRGNIDTRLRKLDEGQYDAIVLAAAGLNRLGKQIDEKAFLPVDLCIPAIGQGTIAVECRKNDEKTIALLRTINNQDTETATAAERSFMKTIGGGCKFPLGAYATIENETVQLSVMLGNHYTQQIIRLSDKAATSEAEKLGIKLAEEIIEVADKLGIEILK